jgi:hypothetical protein
MITSGAVSAPLLPHHQRVIPQTHRNPRLCRSPGLWPRTEREPLSFPLSFTPN